MSDNAVTTVPAGSIMALIARAASDPTVDVGKMQALLEMHERIMAQQARHEYHAAMADVARELEPVERNAQNTHIGNRYATLDAIDAAIRPIYSRHGFSVSYGSQPAADGRVHITCTVAHEGGHSETLGLAAPLDALGTSGRASKTGVQAVGSTVKYLQRYLAVMAFNVTFADPGADDDGEATRRIASAPEATPRPPITDRDKYLGPKFMKWYRELEIDIAQAQSKLGLDAIGERSDVKNVLASAGDGSVQSERATMVVNLFQAAIDGLALNTGTGDGPITDADRWRA